MPEFPEPPVIPYDFKVSCEIRLTPEQRRIVRERTGRDLEVLIIDDEDGKFTRRMRHSNPDDFTLMAIRQAERLNQYDQDYHDYLEALAAAQDEAQQPDPLEALSEKLEISARQEAERMRIFYAKEVEECENARAFAKRAWGDKG